MKKIISAIILLSFLSVDASARNPCLNSGTKIKKSVGDEAGSSKGVSGSRSSQASKARGNRRAAATGTRKRK